jgi:ribosomal protein L32E
MTPEREERLRKEREERIREERIRLRALEIWREQGRPDGRAREHWEQAEREVIPGQGIPDAVRYG